MRVADVVSTCLHVSQRGHTAAVTKDEIWDNLGQSKGTNHELLTLLVTPVTFQQVVLT